MSVAAPVGQSLNRGGRQRPSIRSRTLVSVVAALCIGGVTLTACTSAPPAPISPSAVPSASATPEPSETPVSGPALLPEGTATENLPYFNLLATSTTTANPSADGRAYIDALIAGGFDRGAMQVTFDRTKADLAADAIQFSVNFGDECVIGQIGPATDGFHSVVAPVLSTGLCLVGVTRQIDW